MSGLTDWVPNTHALVVHLPIGLLVSAFATELVALLRRRPEPVSTVSTALYAAGSLTLAAAYLTGRAAAPEVYTPGLAVPVVYRHWTWALWCVVYFGGLTAARVGLLERGEPRRRLVHLAFGAAGLAGLVLLAATAELGGRLVYEYGVGVAAPLGQ